MMKKFKLLLLLFAMAMPVAFVSCEEEEEDPVDYTSDACLDELTALSDVLYNKSMIFNNNPTVSTCNDVRSAALALINRAEQCGYGHLYAEQAQFWIEYDCSVFE